MATMDNITEILVKSEPIGSERGYASYSDDVTVYVGKSLYEPIWSILIDGGGTITIINDKNDEVVSELPIEKIVKWQAKKLKKQEVSYQS